MSQSLAKVPCEAKAEFFPVFSRRFPTLNRPEVFLLAGPGSAGFPIS
jgi:hypothetical protein